MRTLDTLADLEFERIVPGHGPVFSGKDQLNLLRDFLAAALEGATTAVRDGRPLEQLKDELDLTRFREKLARDDVARRNFDAFLEPLIERVYLEASGKLDRAR